MAEKGAKAKAPKGKAAGEKAPKGKAAKAKGARKAGAPRKAAAPKAEKAAKAAAPKETEAAQDGRAGEIGLHSLRPKPGSRRARRRVGRGEGSGLGKTSGRGQKGAGSRSGAKRKAGYEGGQNPIHMRMRKLRGPHMKKSMPFESFRTRTQPVNLADLEQRFEAGAEVTPEALKEKGLAKRSDPVKVLARGEVSKQLAVHAHAFSAAARQKIEAAGGSCHTLEP